MIFLILIFTNFLSDRFDTYVVFSK